MDETTCASRSLLSVTPCLIAVLGCLLAADCARPPKPGDPLLGLRRAQRDRFEKGRLVFERRFTPETGLGPLFNAVSCGECHEEPKSGGSGDEVELHATAFLVRAGGAASRRTEAAGLPPEGTCDPLTDQGGPVVQQHVTPALKKALGIDEEPVPARATGKGMRTTPDLFGFGLLDAVPAATILQLADPDDYNHDGISGRPNRFTDGRIGRFGRKAFVPTLREFNEGAFLNEMGITTPAMPAEGTIGGEPVPPGVDTVPDPELSQEDFDLADDFVRFLAAPAPLRRGAGEERGRAIFATLGCASCHVPVLETGDSEVAALRHKRVAAYTDLLLHDMGPDLADICLGLATPSEFRTEPLMGLHLATKFLHDGRAASIEEAIVQHGGEGAAARDRFKALSDADRARLVEFLKAL